MRFFPAAPAVGELRFLGGSTQGRGPDLAGRSMEAEREDHWIGNGIMDPDGF